MLFQHAYRSYRIDAKILVKISWSIGAIGPAEIAMPHRMALSDRRKQGSLLYCRMANTCTEQKPIKRTAPY